MILSLLLRRILWPLSVLYGAIVRTRLSMYQKGWFKQKRLKATVKFNLE